MKILSTAGWSDYELIDSGNRQRLERFGPYKLIRPDPQIIWKKQLPQSEWNTIDAVFKRIKEDQGKWILKRQIPYHWLMKWNDLSFWIKLSPFKHTGVFPEQTLQWEWMEKIIANSLKQFQKTQNILNLFAYTGIASLVCAQAGTKVTHVDASRPTISWARENQTASHLVDKPIRWILDDAVKFVERDIKRGVKYDGIIMDPPVYGHGPTGQIWKFSKDFPALLEKCIQLLSDHPLFIVINAYAISSSALMLENILQDATKHLGGAIEVGELTLQEKHSKRLLSTGIFARWSCSS